MKSVLLFIALVTAPLSVIAETRPCPMADKAYVLKFWGSINFRLAFNKDCTEALANSDGEIERLPLVSTPRGWEARDGKYLLVFSPSGKSVEMFSPEWRVNGRMHPIKTN